MGLRITRDDAVRWHSPPAMFRLLFLCARHLIQVKITGNRRSMFIENIEGTVENHRITKHRVNTSISFLLDQAAGRVTAPGLISREVIMKRQPTVRTRQTAQTGQARPVPAPQADVVQRARRKAAGMAQRGNSGTELAPEELNRMTAAAAYARAEQRGFAAGHELEDWLAAEAEIKHLLTEHGAAAS